MVKLSPIVSIIDLWKPLFLKFLSYLTIKLDVKWILLSASFLIRNCYSIIMLQYSNNPFPVVPQPFFKPYVYSIETLKNYIVK